MSQGTTKFSHTYLDQNIKRSLRRISIDTLGVEEYSNYLKPGHNSTVGKFQGVLPSYRLIGMCSWIGGKNCIGSKATKIGSIISHSIDYNEVGGSERLVTPNHQILTQVFPPFSSLGFYCTC